MDFSNSCRLCLSKEGRQFPIFKSTNDGLEPLSVRILSYLSIEVSQYDDLPKQICHKCECQVNVWHYYKAECAVSQCKLMRWQRSLENPSTQYIPEEWDEEVVQIKHESEDLDLHIEHNINHDEDLGNTEICSRYDPSTELTESAQNFHDNVRSDDQSDHDSLNLVISATASIQSGGTTSDHASDCSSKGGNGSEVKEVFDGSGTSVCQYQTENELANTNISDDVFPEDQPQRHQIIEVNLVNSDDGDSLEAGGPLGTEDPLGDLEEGDAKCTNGLFKIKEESEEPWTECYDGNLLTRECESSEGAPTKVSPASANLCSKDKRLGAKRSRGVSSKFIYNLSHVDLPKINNEAFDENTKYCKICKKSYLRSNLWRHMKDHHASLDPFRCGGCGNNFPGRRELVTHRVRTISKYCRAGKEPEVDMSSILCHTKVKRGQMGKYECVECKAKFRQVCSAKAHVRIHTGEKPFFCYKCNKQEFRLKKVAYKHVSKCHGKNDATPIFSKEKITTVPSSIAVSKVLKHRAGKTIFKKENNFKCSKCGKVFTNGRGFSNHRRKDCLEIMRRCFSCSESFPRRTFYKHFRKCLKSPADQVPENGNAHAESSPVSASTSGSVGVSSTIDSCATSNSENIVNCSDSDKKEPDISEDVKKIEGTKLRRNTRITKIVDVSLKELLTRHKKDGKAILKCQICERTMGNRKSMYSHLLKHCGKAFRCELCNVRMSLRSTYDAHMVKFHDGFHGTNYEKGDMTGADSSSNQRKDPLKPLKSKLSVKFSGFKLPKLKCEICLKLFSSASSLKFHKLTHKRIKCEKCDITFPASMEKSHVCSPKIKTELVSCDKQQTALQVLPEARAVQYTCHLCKKKFHTRKMLYQHKKMHIKMKIFKCNICANSFSNAGAFQKHKEEMHSNQEESSPIEQHADAAIRAADSQQLENVKSAVSTAKLWKCGVCFKSFSRKDTYTKHMKLHRAVSLLPIAIQKPQNPGVLYCSLCDKAFETQASFKCHKGWHSRTDSITELSIAQVKSGSPVITDDAANGVSNQDSASILSPPVLSFSCDICSKQFATQRNLRIHVSCTHAKDRSTSTDTVRDGSEDPKSQSNSPQPSMPFKCELCSKTFPNISSFSLHMNSHVGSSDEAVIVQAAPSKVLPKSEQLQCKLCNKEYRCKKSLKYHMMGHSGEKPYKCRSCSNQYSNPNALSKHEKERHTVVLRPFSCNKCKSSFILKEDLLAHVEKCTH